MANSDGKSILIKMSAFTVEQMLREYLHNKRDIPTLDTEFLAFESAQDETTASLIPKFTIVVPHPDEPEDDGELVLPTEI